MTNINLAPKNVSEEQHSSLRDWGIFLLVVFLLALIYFGLAYYNRWANQKLSSLEQEYQKNYESLLSKGESVFDFQNRLEVAKKVAAEKNYALESLGELEKAILPEIYVETFVLDKEKGTLNLTLVTTNYRLIANQVASLKQSGYFTEVFLSQSKNREGGKIEATLDLKLK